MDGFNSVEALYKRLTPALRSKKKELIKSGVLSINEMDIWCCLRDTKWTKSTNLTLADMVNDIMLIEDEELAKYKLKKVELTL